MPLRPLAGWITYIPKPQAILITPPPDVSVERTPHGNLYTLWEEPFTTDNAEHLARAAAMEKAMSLIRR
jgi:hypothetical protein